MERKGAPVVLTLTAADQIAEILERIQASQGTYIVVDCAEHALLRDGAVLRETLERAARELGKEVVFHRGPAGAKPTNALGRRPRTLPPAPLTRKALRYQGDHARLRVPLPAFAVPRRSSKGVLFLFAFVTGAILTAVVLFVLPRATVTVILASEPLVADFTVWLETSVTEPRPEGSTHPARLVHVERVLEGTFPVGTIVERGERAHGDVELVNQTVNTQGIKARTRLQSASGVIVRTERDAILPPRGRVSVLVRAEEGGTRGNLDRQRLTMPALTPEAQRLLYGELKTPLRGGEDRAVHALAESDLDRASTALKRPVEEALQVSVRAAIREGGNGSEDRALFERPELRRIVVTELQPSVALGTESEQVTLRATVRGDALAVPDDALARFLGVLAQARAGEGKTVADAPRTDALRVVDTRWEQGRVELSLHLETLAVSALATKELRERLSGRTRDDAEAFLTAIPGIRSSRVALSPFWVRRVPSLVRNIQIQSEAE